MGTQVFAVFLCAFGLLMPALPWFLIGLVYVYCIAWTLIMDWVKLVYYWAMDKRDARSAALEAPLTGLHP